MTAPAVIHAESLGKNYRRGLQADQGLRHAIEKFVRNPLSLSIPPRFKIDV